MRSLDIASLHGAGHIRTRGRLDDNALQPAPPAPAAEVVRGGDAGISVETAIQPATQGAPVDTERVRVIRDALREGTYPLDPTKIAEAMITSRLLLEIEP